MRTLILGKTYPEPSSSAAGTRMMQLIDFFLSEGSEVYFGSAAGTTPWSEQLPAGLRHFPVTLNDALFDEEVKKIEPELVIFDRFSTEEQFGWRITEQCPNALRVLDLEDLHCLREARATALKQQRDFREEDLLNDIAMREIASIYRCDLTLVISSTETDLLRRFFKVDEKLIFYLPFMYEQLGDYHVKTWPGFEEREGFICIGNLLHQPNLDAIQYLKSHIWPLVREQVPKAQVNIYGGYSDKYVEKFHAPGEGFFMRGRAADSRAVQKSARVNLAPLRFGAGMKGKLAEAMICGTPSVTTPVGAESMGTRAGWPGCVANSPQEIAACAVILHNEEQAWKKAQDKIRPCFNDTFNGIRDQKRLKIKLSDLAARLKEHRAKNFTGAMLSHQMVHAKRWLAKYLETKTQLSRVTQSNEEKKNWQERT